MDPPSTPAPAALRGKKLDRALCDAEPSRRPWSERDQPPPTPRDPFAELRAAERFLNELPPSSDAEPMSLRGDALAVALELATASRVRVKH
jgi:hypothetical protein